MSTVAINIETRIAGQVEDIHVGDWKIVYHVDAGEVLGVAHKHDGGVWYTVQPTVRGGTKVPAYRDCQLQSPKMVKNLIGLLEL